MAFIRAAFAACLAAASASAYDAFVVTTPGIPGAGGLVPAISATGIATPGSSGNVLALTDAAPNSIAQIVVGFSELAMPYKGGVLGPQPELLTEQFFTNGLGSYEMDFSLPTDTAIGLEIWIQTFVFDAGAVSGLSASNTLRLTAQQTHDITKLYPLLLQSMGKTDDVLLDDFNDDGILDIVAANESAITIRLGLELDDGMFGTAQSFTYADTTGLARLASGDFDADGHMDIAVTRKSVNRMSIMLGNGEGAFSLGETYSTGKGPVGIEVADLNGSGRLDVVFVTSDANKINLRRGKGDGTFWPIHQVAPGNKPIGVAIDDLDADGILDMVVAYWFMNDVAVLMGKGNALYESPVEYPAAGYPSDVDIIDLDEDGILDIVVRDSLLSGSTVLIGAGDGTFAFPTLFTPRDVFPSEYLDFDQDGLLDIVDLSSSDTIAISPGTAPMTYGEPIEIKLACLGLSTDGLRFGDINNDDLPDIIISNADWSVVAAVMNPGDGEIPSFPRLDPELTVVSIAHGDFNGDGQDDLVFAHTPESLSVKLATGDGTFDAPIPLVAADTGPFNFHRNVYVEDFNNDGTLDVLWNPPGRVAMFLGLGDGTFSASLDTPLPGDPDAVRIVASDLDGDGVIDLTLAVDTSGGSSAHHYMSMLGVGDGTFSLGTPATPTGLIKQMDVCDLDGDGHHDLILAANDRLDVRFGLGNGSFGEKTMPIVVGPGTGLISSFAAGDFDSDTTVDLVVTWQGGFGTQFQFAHGNGDGTFDLVPPKTKATPLRRGEDLNNDGALDLLFQGSSTIMPGNGDGTFEPPIGFHCLGAAQVTISDFNGDCILDIATTGEGIGLLLSSP